VETHACRMRLLCCRPNWMCLMSYDSSPLIATQGRLFFSHRRHTLLLFVYVFSFQHHSLSLHRRPLLFRQQHSLSLSLLKRSLTRSVCSYVPVGLSCSPPPATRALRITLNFSLLRKPALQQAVRSRARRRKGPADVDRAVPCDVAAARRRL
jgi:hypothetical protein